MQATIFSVSEVNRAIKQFIEGTQTFKNIFIQGDWHTIQSHKCVHLGKASNVWIVISRS